MQQVSSPKESQRLKRPLASTRSSVVTSVMTTEEATSKEKKEVSPCHTHLSIRQLFRSIDQAIVNMPNVADLEPLDLLATRIIPEVEKMEVAGR